MLYYTKSIRSLSQAKVGEKKGGLDKGSHKNKKKRTREMVMKLKGKIRGGVKMRMR